MTHETPRIQLPMDTDPTAESRKSDHIDLAFQSQVVAAAVDTRFEYEPMLSGFPDEQALQPFEFLGKTFRAPLWVSSMTGGTGRAARINQNLARACAEFGFGMGLGSCRQLLYDQSHVADFDVRHIIGDEQALYVNLGIAQVELMWLQNDLDRIHDLVELLKADGLIIHVNPMQEWLQPEGDQITRPPLETIAAALDALDIPIIVKEVGQGFGPASMKALLKMPLAAIDFAASGGTNFALLEMLRDSEEARDNYMGLAQIGHTAEEMVGFANSALSDLGDQAKCKQIIISGGIKSFLDGYYLTQSINTLAIYGQASSFLKHAMDDYETLREYVSAQINGLRVASAYLSVKS